MENADAFGSSTAPLTWQDFLDRMRHPSAVDFVKAIKSFIVPVLSEAPDPERHSAAVQEFLGKMEAAFRAHILWAGSSEKELESAGEGLEKYVMTKLYPRVFASIPEDVNSDKELSHKISLLQQFVRPEHLDIKPTYQNEAAWLLAQKELQKINMYKAPRDKLVCILNCCKVINNLLLNASIASNEDHPGADEFLPVLIYVTIKANPPQLHSNLAYIQRFRRQTRLVSEAAYFFTNMLSAESFIANINANSLEMDEEEFQRNMESSQSLLSGLLDTSENSTTTTQIDQRLQHASSSDSLDPNLKSSTESSESKSQGPLHEKDCPSVSKLEEQGEAQLMKEDDMSQILRDFPYLYCQAGDLTVGDVQDLLSRYKHLVVKYVSLARGLGVTPESSQTTADEAAVVDDDNHREGLPLLVEDHSGEKLGEKAATQSTHDHVSLEEPQN